MASPPFNPNESLPGNSDVTALFPAQERTFRDIIESWLLFEHDRSGHHAFYVDDQSTLDSDDTWVEGSIRYNTTTGQLEVCTDDDPALVWAGLGIPTGTKMLFQQTSAPTGWTKQTDSSYNGVAFRGITGTVSSGGSTAFTDAFKSQTPAGTVGGTAISIDQMPLHSHPLRICNANDDANGLGGVIMRNQGTRTNTDYTGTPDDTFGHQMGGSGGGQTHTHTFTGTAMALDVKYLDVIVATKD
jgi:hypothetical protein